MGVTATDQATKGLDLMGVTATDQAAGGADRMGAAATDQAAGQLDLMGAAATDQAATRCCLVGSAAGHQAAPRRSFFPTGNIHARYERSWRSVACVAKLDTFLVPNKFGIRGSSRKTAVTPGLPRVLQFTEVRPVSPVTFMPVARSEITPSGVMRGSFWCEEKVSFPSRDRV